jgi:protein regulator of cytokinesis 1
LLFDNEGFHMANLNIVLQSNRLEKVLEYVSMVHDLCTVLGMDFLSTVTEVHSSLDDSIADNCKSISDDTLSKLDQTVATLHEDKKLRLSKVKPTHFLVLS